MFCPLTIKFNIANLLIDDRRDLSDLRAEYPDNADTFEHLQMQLNMPTAEADAKTHQPSVSRTAIVEELENCINEIRKLPGHDGFLRPPSSDER